MELSLNRKVLVEDEVLRSRFLSEEGARNELRYYKPIQTMAKKIKAVLKLNIPAGKATPAPPIGPALGQHGVPIMDFCKAYNEKTREMGDVVAPAVITIYEDRSFDFEIKTPPVTSLLLKLVGKEKGSAVPNRDKIGKVTRDQLRQIAEQKMADLNARSIDQAIKIIEGSARSIGIEVEN